MRIRITALFMSLLFVFAAGCGQITTDTEDDWLEKAALNVDISEEELYKAALKEDVLIVYTVSTRTVQTKEAFEKAYPGLVVEIRDLRSPDLVDKVAENFAEGRTSCDVVICNDNSGEFKSRLVDTGAVVPYLSAEIKKKMKDGHVGECISFLDEAELLFYNSRLFETQPVSNIWELTESRFSGMIYIPNPLRSFSTYAFIAATFDHADELEEAYKSWCGRDFDRKDGTAPEALWKEISKNAVFTNSSDEVMEALNTDKVMLGIMISSKLRYKNMGYGFEPAYRLTPFSGCRTTVSVMLARNSQNVNSAKLFIDFLLGGSDGTGDGYKPFRTPGAWSARTDVGDGTDTPLSEIDLLYPDADSMITRKDEFYKFWSECLKDQTNR